MKITFCVIGNKSVNIIYSNFSLNIWIQHKKIKARKKVQGRKQEKGIEEQKISWNICLEQRPGSSQFINLKCISSLAQCFTVASYCVLFEIYSILSQWATETHDYVISILQID